MKTQKYMMIIALAALLSLFLTGCDARMGHTMHGPYGTTYVEASTDGFHPGHKHHKHHKPKKHKKHKKHHKKHHDKHYKKHHHHDD